MTGEEEEVLTTDGIELAYYLNAIQDNNSIFDDCSLDCRQFNHTQLEKLYSDNELLQTVCNFYPEEATKLIPKINLLSEDLKDYEAYVNKEFSDYLITHNIQEMICDVLIRTNVYGSYLLIKDEYSGGNIFNPYPFHMTSPIINIVNGLEKITGYNIGGLEVSHRDVIRLDSGRQLLEHHICKSFLARIIPFYKNYIRAIKKVDRIFQSQSTVILSISELINKLSKGKRTSTSKSAKEQIRERLMLIDNSLQKMSPLALDKEEERLEYLDQNLVGVTDLFNVEVDALASVTQLPRQIIVGGNTYKLSIDERLTIAGNTAKKQKQLTPIYKSIVGYLFGYDLAYAIDYPPTIEMTPTERAELKEREQRAEKLNQEHLNLSYIREYAQKYDLPLSVSKESSNEERLDRVGKEMDNERNIF